MTASYRALIAVLEGGTQRVLHNSCEVDSLIAAAEQLVSLHYKKLASPWDLPKLLCAALRVQLNAQMTHPESVALVPSACLHRLLLAAWHLCPLVSLPPPVSSPQQQSASSSFSSPTSSSTLSLSSSSTSGLITEGVLRVSPEDAERVAAELAAMRETNRAKAGEPTAVPLANKAVRSTAGNYRTALSVLMALLSYWHTLAAEEEACTADASIAAGGSEVAEDANTDFEHVSETVWRCVLNWTAPKSVAGVRGVALATWLCTVLRRALQSNSIARVLHVVSWLEGFLSMNTCRSAVPESSSDAFTSTALDACWTRLHTRVCQHVCTYLHQGQSALKDRWTASVAPVLARAVAQEPPLLSGASLQAFYLDEPLEDSLGSLTSEACRLSRRNDGGSGDTITAEGHDVTVHTAATVVGPLLQLAALQRLVERAQLRVVPFIQAQTYATCLRPVVAVCLRWGLVDAACTLLEWAGESLDGHGREWRVRLQQRGASPQGNGVFLPREKRSVCAALVAEEKGQADCSTHYSYPIWLQQRLTDDSCQELCVTSALDTLVWCDDPNHRRLVCDALLRCPAPWAAQVLKDPFAAYFILRTLAAVAAHHLQAGDPPLARFYIVLLVQLLPRYLCPTLLSTLLHLLHRLAGVLSSYTLSPLNYSAPCTTHGESVLKWRQISEFLDQAQRSMCTPSDCSAAETDLPALHRDDTFGAAWKARREFQQHCTRVFTDSAGLTTDTPARAFAEDATDSIADVRCVVVELQYLPDGKGTLRLQWQEIHSNETTSRAHRTATSVFGSIPSSTAHRACIGASLRACAAEMTDILRCNREQLLRGTGSAGPGAEKALCVDSQGGSQSFSTALLEPTALPCQMASTETHSATSSCTAEEARQQQQEGKRQWWHARFELDFRISRVVTMLQSSLGAARVLLAGRPSDALSVQLSCLALAFATECTRLREGALCPPLHALHVASTHVLLAGPLLWSSPQGKSDAQSTCFYSPNQHVTCPACASTLHNARGSVLRAIAELGQDMTPSTPSGELRHVASKAATTCEAEQEKQECWVALLLDASIADLADALVEATLNAYYAECTQYAARTTNASSSPSPCPPSAHTHTDLLLHPRAHTYLILGGELHGLPWEGLDVLREGSTSRVPSLDFLQHALDSLSGAAVSLRRTLLYRDHDAAQSVCGLTEVLRRHPAWELEHGETLAAAAAAQKHGRTPSSPSSLLRRVVGAPHSADHLDTYVYAGHRGGEQLVARAALYEWCSPLLLPVQPSLVLLMGCSSARSHGNATFDAFGLPQAYLSAGASCFVGCLWDVTDGDVDRLTCRLLQCATEGATSTTVTVGEALAVARRACRLRCLTGLATVFYGVNLPIEGSVTTAD